MPHIEFRENKILKLNNVLSRKVPTEELFSQDKHIAMMANWIKAKGYESVGPLILYSGGITGMDNDDKPLIDSKIMVQLKQKCVRLGIDYSFKQEIRVEKCLFARFNDNGEKMQFALNKLTLFAYENELNLSGEAYIVIIEQKEKRVLCDVFMPVLTKEEE